VLPYILPTIKKVRFFFHFRKEVLCEEFAIDGQSGEIMKKVGEILLGSATGIFSLFFFIW